MTPAIRQLNDRTVELLASALNDYPCHIPFDVQQATREAINLYQGGSRDPEVLMTLGFVAANVMTNRLRWRIHNLHLQAASEFAL